MSSNGRSVRVRGEKREQLDVARFARAVLALYAQLQAEAKAAADASAEQSKSPADGGTSDGRSDEPTVDGSETTKPEAGP